MSCRNLERCDVYFLDGDHNYHTVRRELELIRQARPPTRKVPLRR